MADVPFISDSTDFDQSKYPMQRFLPQVPNGLAGVWLERGGIPKGSWVLDPLGANPQLSLDTAVAGYKVLVAINNPILQLILEITAKSPDRDDFVSILADLAGVRRGTDRLEPHIQSLYLSDCPICHRSLPATTFYWKRNDSKPFMSSVNCPICGEAENTNLLDPEILTEIISRQALTQSRAIERANPLSDVQKTSVQEIINCYTPRALYGLFTIFNRSEALSLSANQRQLLNALLLSACEESSSLWSWPPGERLRPRTISISSEYREKNIWIALEEAIEGWTCRKEKVEIVRWPEELKNESGIVLFPGRFRELPELPPEITLQAIITAVPYPNQAFWSLSSVWSGWIFGRSAVEPMRNVLQRKRYDSHWTGEALLSVFRRLAKSYGEIPVFAALPELIPGHLLAIMTAMQSASYLVKDFALCAEDNSGQGCWSVKRSETTESVGTQKAILDLLDQRSEPSPYLSLFACGLLDLEKRAQLAVKKGTNLGDWMAEKQIEIRKIFSQKEIFIPFGSEDRDSQGVWWKTSETNWSEPLSEQVEREAIKYMIDHTEYSKNMIRQHIYTKFPGLKTPSSEFIELVINSYSRPSGSNTLFNLRVEDEPVKRRKEIETISNLLLHIGSKFGFSVKKEYALTWNDQSGRVIYRYDLLASAMMGRFLLDPEFRKAEKNNILVIPREREGLIQYKLDHDPRMEQAIKKWKILWFDDLLKIDAQDDTTIENWELFISKPQDGLNEDGIQLSIL
jgi:hypothetical protein